MENIKITVKSTRSLKIRVDGIKKDIKKGETLKIDKERVSFFKVYGFVELKAENIKSVNKKEEKVEVVEKDNKKEVKKVTKSKKATKSKKVTKNKEIKK